MGRIAARFVSASMIQLQTFGNRTVLVLPGYAMNILNFALISGISVARSQFAACPDVTASLKVHKHTLQNSVDAWNQESNATHPRTELSRMRPVGVEVGTLEFFATVDASQECHSQTLTYNCAPVNECS